MVSRGCVVDGWSEVYTWDVGGGIGRGIAVAADGTHHPAARSIVGRARWDGLIDWWRFSGGVSVIARLADMA